MFSRQEPDFSKLTNNLGTDWLIDRVSLKYFNCCYFIHAPLDAFLTIINENSIHYLDIKKVLVGISKYAIEHVGTIKKPIDLLGAQFSLTYTLTMSVIFGYPKLDSYRELLLDNKEINLLEEKIEIYNDEVAQSEYPYNRGAIVTIFTHNGQSFSLRSRYPKGMPENPMSLNEVWDKFKINIRTLPNEKQGKLQKIFFNGNGQEFTHLSAREFISYLIN